MIEHHIVKITRELNLQPRQVAATAVLLEEGGTVPFIARYRKERTGELDEVQITAIRDRLEQLGELDKRREAILSSLEERKLLTEELKAKIGAVETLTALEDIYLPFRPKKRTKATIANERGLEPLAEILWAQNASTDPEAEAVVFVDAEKEVPDAATALAGARDILAERINDDAAARAKLRALYLAKGVIKSKVAFGKEEEGAKFKDYFDWSEPAANSPSHRILAIRRGESEGFLYSRLTPPEDEAVAILDSEFVAGKSPASQQVRLAVEDCYKRLLGFAMEAEARMFFKKKADEEAIRVFAENLRELLLASPLGQKNMMAIDPGFRTGCKIAVLDRQGKLLYHDVIYPEKSAREQLEAAEFLHSVTKKYGIEAIAIGNGTASRETEAFVNKCKLPGAIPVVVVNESGASIYSASEVAREEFPDLDLTVRGAVSIGRRLMDPLAELVKLDPKSIGVGQYQHDVDQNALRRSLDDTVVSCVNSVGVELNTASKHLLGYVSGLNSRTAASIVEHRDKNGPFSSRKELLKVAGLGPKAFEQAAGFLRIRDGSNPLDASSVHPERYPLLDSIAQDLGCGVTDLIRDGALRSRAPDPHRHPPGTREARPRSPPEIRSLPVRRGRGKNGAARAGDEASGHRDQRDRVRGVRGHRRPPGRARPHQPALRPVCQKPLGRREGRPAGAGHGSGGGPRAQADRPLDENQSRSRPGQTRRTPQRRQCARRAKTRRRQKHGPAGRLVHRSDEQKELPRKRRFL